MYEGKDSGGTPLIDRVLLSPIDPEFILHDIQPLRMDERLLAGLRRIAPDGNKIRRTSTSPDNAYYFYVVDGSERLRGVVPTGKLFQAAVDLVYSPVASDAPPVDPRVEDVMISDGLVTLNADATTADAFEMFMSRMFLAVPLIDECGRYTGRCVSRRLYDSTNVDRVFAAEHDKEEADEELRVAHRIGQSDPDSQHWLHTLFVRGTWLSLNFVHGFLGLGILLLCESVIHRVTMLACLIPMFLTLSESVGMQSTHLATHPDGRKRRRFEESLAIELLSSVALGLLCCSVVGLIAFVWHSVAAALVVSFSMFTSIFTTGAAAHLLPHMLRRFNIDPRAASAPIVLAIADLVTLGVVFGVAKYFL